MKKHTIVLAVMVMIQQLKKQGEGVGFAVEGDGYAKGI